MLDGTVLPRRIHRLEKAEDRPAVLGVKHVLQVGESLHPLLQQRRRLLLAEVEPGRVAAVPVLEVEALALLHPVAGDQLAALLDIHGVSPQACAGGC
jgi:hypothetical protein